MEGQLPQQIQPQPQRQNNTRTQQPNFTLLEALMHAADDETHRIAAVHAPNPDERVDAEPCGQIWAYLHHENQFSLFAHFTEEEVLELYRLVEPNIMETHRHGKAPKLSWEDHLLVLLMWYKRYFCS